MLFLQRKLTGGSLGYVYGIGLSRGIATYFTGHIIKVRKNYGDMNALFMKICDPKIWE